VWLARRGKLAVAGAPSKLPALDASEGGKKEAGQGMELAGGREAGCLVGRERRREVRKEDAQGMELAGGRESAYGRSSPSGEAGPMMTARRRGRLVALADLPMDRGARHRGPADGGRETCLLGGSAGRK